VAPIFYGNCVACHRAGEFAPMSLMSYDDARPWARAIKQRVTAREMPPWNAEPGHQEYANDARLSTRRDRDHRRVGGWQRAPGERYRAPSGTDLRGRVDHRRVRCHLHDDGAVRRAGRRTVPYLYFTIPTNLPEDKWVKGIEFVPGDRTVVHHIIASLQSPDSNIPPSPEPALREDRRRRTGITPNKFGVTYPEGVARRITAGTEVVMQMH
jgi:hypothetical protein